jgi:transcriptional regulator with XRE-family HTH domain
MQITAMVVEDAQFVTIMSSNVSVSPIRLITSKIRIYSSFWCIMSLYDICSAKQIGKLLRSSREAQRANLQHISKQCGLSVAQLVHIESGNLFAFESNLEKIMSYSNVYARALKIDINTFSETLSMAPVKDPLAPVDGYIPRFLIKQA